MITNSHIHQRGSGLLSSRRSSSHTWPVVLSLAMTLRRAAMINSARQASKDNTVATATNQPQAL